VESTELDEEFSTTSAASGTSVPGIYRVYKFATEVPCTAP